MKRLLVLLATCFSLLAHGQYQQPMTYRDYAFYYQMRVGFPGTLRTDSCAFLELGTPTGSKRGFLNARGFRADVISPKYGLWFHDLTPGYTYNEPIWHDGTNWRRLYYLAGVGVSITGAGTPEDPYTINATGGAFTDTNDLFARGNDTATTENMRFHGRGFAFEADSFSKYKTGVQVDSTLTGTVEIDTLARTIITHQKVDTLTGDTSIAQLHIAEDSTSLLVHDSSGFVINKDSLLIKTKTGKVFIDTLPQGGNNDSTLVYNTTTKQVGIRQENKLVSGTYSTTTELLTLTDARGNTVTVEIPAGTASDTHIVSGTFTGTTLTLVDNYGGTVTVTIPASSGSGEQSKDITVESPSTTENIGIWQTKSAITITELADVVVGSSSPSVTYQISFGPVRGVASNNLLSASRTVSSTSGSTTTSFNDATIPAGSWIFITTSATAGTVTQFSVTLTYTID